MIGKHIKNIFKFLNKPYGLLQNRLVKLLMMLGYGFSFIIIVLFIPFELNIWSESNLFFIVLLACAINAVIGAIHLYLLQDLIFKKFTILTTFLWWIWIDLVNGFVNFIIGSIFRYNKVFLWKYMYNDMIGAIILDILPTIIIILIYHNYLLKKKIKTVNEINTNLVRYQNKLPVNTGLTLTSKNQAQVLTIDSNSLLYITSADNYIELFWKENAQIKKTLLRNTLTNIEGEIKKQCEYITRCHHSYVVNLKKIDSLSGNSAGYKIILDGISFPIPVSRKYIDVFLKRLSS
jgi:hypothetical protein